MMVGCPRWSKGAGLGPVVVSRFVGSNPTPTTKTQKKERNTKMLGTTEKIKEIVNEQDKDVCEKTCDKETIAVVQLKNILKDLALIKKYSFEKDDERIYLCADHIERELHMLQYGGAILDNRW